MQSKLEFKFRKLFSGKVAGNFASIFKGGGLEIEDFRKYYPGDDVRRINWKLSAKQRELYISLFKEEKDVDIHIFLDINYNWKSYKETIEEALGDLCILSRKAGAATSITYFDKKLKISKPTKNLSFVYGDIKKAFASISTVSSKYVSNISAFLRREKSFYKRHIIVIFSDFISISDEDIKLLKAFREKNELVFINIPVIDIVTKTQKAQLKNTFFSDVYAKDMIDNYKKNMLEMGRVGRIFSLEGEN